MKVSREQAQENRQKVVEAAARLFRERGIDGIGLAELMKSVGLTHGGFYGQFGSKEELVAEACALAFERSVAKWKRTAQAHPADATRAIAQSYLSPEHRDHPGGGCAAAALASDIAREGTHARQAFTQGVCDLVEVMAGAGGEATSKARRRQALADFSTMVGAMVLARAVDDPQLADEILAAARAAL
jgi:TetR/AcrR family transcriptional repressor of nem operon